MFSSSEIGVDGIGICLDLVSKFVECFEGGSAMEVSEVRSLKKGFLVMNSACHGRRRC